MMMSGGTALSLQYPSSEQGTGVTYLAALSYSSHLILDML
jgi:hypothetical protein